MAGSDVKAKRITGTGSLAVGPARIRQIQLKTASGTPRLTVTDASGGATVLDLDPMMVTGDISESELLFKSDIFIQSLSEQ